MRSILINPAISGTNMLHSMHAVAGHACIVCMFLAFGVGVCMDGTGAVVVAVAAVTAVAIAGRCVDVAIAIAVAIAACVAVLAAVDVCC